MTRRPERNLRWFAMLMAIAIVVHACVELNEGDERNRVNLRWVKSYPDESKEKVTTGLAWGLSFLGAALPKGAIKQAAIWKDESRFELDISRLGISAEQRTAWQELLKAIKQSDEYQKKGAMDVGRFIALTINSSNHYYALTGVDRDYTSFRKRFSFRDSLAAIVESGVSPGDRLIEVARGNEMSTVAFVAQEGAGSIEAGTFSASEYEVFDVMPNGQLRFAIYDSQGQLKTAADPLATLAGKPAKCLWCHEINVQRPFYAKTNIAGFYTVAGFEKVVAEKTAIIQAARQKLKSDIDFSRTQDHTELELLYISFMEPSAERLALEWGLTTVQVQTILAGIATHDHVEFTFLRNLYHRRDVDHLAPYEVLRVPEDAREKSIYEPDFLNHP